MARMTSSRQEANKLPSLSTGTIPGLVPDIDRLGNGNHDRVVVAAELVARQALVAALSQQADEARRRKKLLLRIGRLALGLLGRPGLGFWFCQQILRCCRCFLGCNMFGLLRSPALILPSPRSQARRPQPPQHHSCHCFTSKPKAPESRPRQPRRRIRTGRRGSCQPSCW